MSTFLNVNSSKKYDEWIGENSQFFSNLENDYDVTVDAVTQDLIELFFGNRYICDDDNFERFYKRTLLNTWDRYVDLLRIEKTEIDPLVADYFENQLVHTGEMTGSKQGATSGMVEYGKIDTLTHNVTVTEDNSVATDETDTRTLNLANSNTRTDNLTTTTDNKQARGDAVNPQSLEYSGTIAGSLPSLDWQYMSNQAQEEGSGTEQQTGTVANAGTQTGTDINVKDKDVSEDKSKRTTGTDAHVLSGADETSGNSTEATSGTDSHTDRERHTGRTGILPQEALRRAKAYIQKSRAFDWLKDELEPCFISIYDI